MAAYLEGRGYLYQGDRLVAPVRYRLYWPDTNALGPSIVGGELRPLAGVGHKVPEGRFLLHTEAGMSLPVAVIGSHGEHWRPFHRLPRDRADRGLAG